MSLGLITNRTASDVNYAKSFQGKKWADLTAAQKEEYLKGLKGAYSYIDFNRVINAVKYLSEVLISYGYPNCITQQSALKASSTPVSTFVQTYIDNIAELKNKYYSNVEGSLPTTSNWLNYEKANYMEKVLQNIDDILIFSEKYYMRSGAFASGQNRVWQQRFRRSNKWINFNYSIEKGVKAWNTVSAPKNTIITTPIDMRDDVVASINTWNKKLTDLDTLVGG